MADSIDLYAQAMKVTDQAQADELFERLIQAGIDGGRRTREEAIDIVKQKPLDTALATMMMRQESGWRGVSTVCIQFWDL